MNYYGVRYARDCHPGDLWVKYFTSSDYVTNYIIEHGNPDIIEIRQQFTGENRRARAILYEHQVLKRMNVVKRQDYLNKHDAKSIDLLGDPDVMRRWAESMTKVRNDPVVKMKTKLSHQENSKRKAAADTRIHHFVHSKTGKNETCSVTSLALFYNLNITLLGCMIDRSRRTVKGWKLAAADITHGHTDRTKHHFIHKDGVTEHCTRKELERKYSINSGNLCEMMNGNRKSCKGWRVINTR